MTRLVYLLDIASATTDLQLMELKSQAATDADLSARDRELINHRIAQTYKLWKTVSETTHQTP
jgi:hypothetical protein